MMQYEGDTPRAVAAGHTLADRIFRGMALGSGLMSFAIIGGTLIFLATYAWPAISSQGWGFLTSSVWSPASEKPVFGIFGLITGTLQLAIVALVVAVPVSFTLALFIHEYAPRWLRKPMVNVVDFMAAMPSVIFGLWGWLVFQAPLKGVAIWLGDNLSVIPLFKRPGDASGSLFIAGFVVGLMILPICTSVMREVFSQVPVEHCEAALALGGTRWGMVRTAILPFSRSGMVGASLLGLGRALGETIAVSLILISDPKPRLGILEQGGGSVAGTIVLRLGEGEFALRALMGAGLGLFVVTLIVNLGAQRVVAKSRRT
ncbi:MAG: phosphate ABC transporter permease subunit PstC [Acidimicrobiales bacterium]